MTEIVTAQPASQVDAERADRLDRELAEAEGVTRVLRERLDLLSGIQIPSTANSDLFRLICGESAKVATAMSRLRSAHAASITALARLRDAGQPRRVVIEHRYADDDDDEEPGDAA